MIKLSVNVNKVATLRNSRGGTRPSVLEAVAVCVAAGAPGITVHPRADERHITRKDVQQIAAWLRDHPGVEFNIEGDPRPDFLALVEEVRPAQCTLVPVRPGEVTSQAGWPPDTSRDQIRRVIGSLHRRGIRSSLFIDPDPAAVEWAVSVGAQRVELYTEPFAHAFEHGLVTDATAAFDRYARIASLAHSRGLGVNAGHDLDLNNLVPFRALPHLDEVSIGHALISHALFVGLDRSVRDFLALLQT